MEQLAQLRSFVFNWEHEKLWSIPPCYNTISNPS